MIPLYPRERPLKNLLSDWKKTHDFPILCNFTEDGLPVKKELTPTEEIMLDHVIKHWYFASINYDTDDEFVFRFNVCFEDNFAKYDRLVKQLENIFPFQDDITHTDTQSQSGTDSKETTRGGNNTEKKTGTDTFEKGVTTTSDVTTSNEGKKLTRSTPNENLSVGGSSNTVVEDSGSDTNTYDTTVEHTIDEDGTEKITYGNKRDKTVTITRKKLTLEEYNLYISLRSEFEAFSDCFENLFMEVY